MADIFTALSSLRRSQQKALPEPRYQSFPQVGQPVYKNWDARLAISDGFKSSVWVYASTKLIAKSLARVPWRVERVSSGIERDTEEVYDHPALSVLKRPNPMQGTHALMELLVYHMMLAGNALWLKIKTGMPEVPTELHPLEPDTVEPVPGQGMTIQEYIWSRHEHRKVYAPEDIVHFMFQDPASPYWGTSPLQSASRVVDTDVEATKWNKSSLENRGIPSGIFSFDEDLTDEQFEEASDFVRQNYMGALNARTPWILGNRGKWTQVSQTPVDLDFIPGRKFSMVEISAAMGVLPALFAPDAATYSNLQEARKALWADTVTSILEGVRSTMNLQLMPDFEDPDVYRYNYDLSDIDALRDEYEKRVDSATKMAKAGTPWNQAAERMELGIEEVEGGDEPHGLNPDVVIARIKAGSGSEGENTVGEEESKTFEVEGGAPVIRMYTKAVPPSLVSRENRETAELMKVAARLEPELREIFYRIIKELQDTISLEAIEMALAEGSQSQLDRAMPYAEMEERIRKEAGPLLSQILGGAAAVALTHLTAGLGRQINVRGGTFPTDSAYTRAADTAQLMTESTRGAVEEAWSRFGIDKELSTFRATKLYFKTIFGLNRNQQKSTSLFYRGMLKNGAAVADIEGGVAAFSSDHLRSRAALFARQESAIQGYKGQRATWDQARNAGYLKNSRRMWITSREATVCPICRPIDGQIIKFGEKYYSSFNGKRYRAPGPEIVHPDCACGEIITTFR